VRIVFDIQPYVGALPIELGMKRKEVHAVLGRPKDSTKVGLDPIRFDYFGTTTFNVGYNKAGEVIHLGFWPGKVRLAVLGRTLWTSRKQPDPNRRLLELDPEPLEYGGFLIFRKLGVITTGFHQDAPTQRAVSIFPRREWDDRLADAMAHAGKPDLAKYKNRRRP
jgi:hypothetical protein